jgi:hypothetical protein
LVLFMSMVDIVYVHVTGTIYGHGVWVLFNINSDIQPYRYGPV